MDYSIPPTLGNINAALVGQNVTVGTLAIGGATISGSDTLAVTGNGSFTSATVSASGFYVNSASAAYVALNGRANGDIVSFATGRIGFTLSGTNANGVAPDAYITRDGAGTLSMRDGGTNISPVPQAFRVYNYYTDASNYERVDLTYATNIATLQSVAAGTGTARDLRIGHSTYLQFENGSGSAVLQRASSSSATLFNVTTTGGWTSTAINFARLTPTINQASGTYTVLDINPTETAIGAGPHYLIRGRIGAGSDVFNVRNDGTILSNSYMQINAGSRYYFQSRGGIGATADGVFTLSNNSGLGFGRLAFIDSTASNTALKSVSTTLQVRLGDDSAAASLRALALTVDSGTNLITSAVAFTNGAAAATGTLLNAPVAGNPTKWIPINDNGTTRYIPAW